jgi:hypothetical protein
MEAQSNAGVFHQGSTVQQVYSGFVRPGIQFAKRQSHLCQKHGHTISAPMAASVRRVLAKAQYSKLLVSSRPQP